MNAAKAIMTNDSIKAVTFSNIAKSTKLSRPSIYQYYKVPEEILANILMVELADFNQQLATAEVTNAQSLGDIIVQIILSRDLMMQLLAVNFSIIKVNVRDTMFLKLRAIVADFKVVVADQLRKIQPAITEEQVVLIQYALLTMMAAIYPLSNDDGYHKTLVEQQQPDDTKPSYETLLKHEVAMILHDLPSKPQ